MQLKYWQKAKQIVPQAQRLSPAERPDFLDEACGDDAELRLEIEELLAADPQCVAFIENPPLKLLGSQSELFKGLQVGAYRIVRELAHGGMGVVYLATRDDEPERPVAIKILRPGLEGDELDRRFQQEIRILASLDHPNIAELHEVGRTEDGRLYFLLEFIDGEPIDRYCKVHRLSVSQRLLLFQKVIAAVDYAHQNLVIHRDLKPSNILVNADGEPKLLDFGVAKLLNAEDTTLVTVTANGLRLMTPEYASPEQIQGEPMTTASDVYSLGVLLYELLAGQRPYRFERRLEDEIRRVICEEEPIRPSDAVVRQAAIGNDLETAESQPTGGPEETPSRDPETLRRRLRGDLDRILLTALHKEPERRYAGVTQLSEDIRRHLASEPILARKPTFRYRAGRFIRRHRLAVALAATITLVVSGLLLALAHQNRRIQMEAERAQQVSAFLVELFKVSERDPANQRLIRTRDILDAGAQRLQAELHPHERAALLESIGRSYQKLGLDDKAKPLFEESAMIRSELGGGD